MKWCLGMSPNESFSFSGHREDSGFVHDFGDQAFPRRKWEVIVSRTMDGNCKGEDSGDTVGISPCVRVCVCMCACMEGKRDAPLSCYSYCLLCLGVFAISHMPRNHSHL